MNANAVPRDAKSAVLILRSTLRSAPIVDILSAKSMKNKIVIYSKCTTQIEDIERILNSQKNITNQNSNAGKYVKKWWRKVRNMCANKSRSL